MNAKKIAERLRRLAKYEIPSQPFTSRELKGIITDIADELDPPEPQPTYKVGDWVEYKKGKHHQVDSVHDGCCYLSYGKGCGCFSALYSDITRKLDPSEVVIRIGCLSGTVTYAISDDCFLLAKVNDPQHRACCIDMSMLDTPTREMVESLLRAQEEK